MRKSVIAIVLAAIAIPALPAQADPPPWAPAHGRRAKERAIYDSRGRYYEPRAIGERDRVWRGGDGRYYCRRGNGTTGLVIGGAVGALVGRELDGGRDRTVGTVLGAAGGALLGREIDRGGMRCR
ncbi:glycine zipper 2TM domain-containing protein [Phenylobacterium sp. LjRoot225]|uniref:glycine zipper 2TM domain-containing protein n=1 Tax=Phenylobacterium sp. LjRoot225 TaxID=3342285 RepID=UPI003ECF7244